MTEPVVWVDGHLRTESEARISPFDHGLLTGDGIYETLVALGGVPFAWTRHVRRMRSAAAALDLALPSGDVLWEAVDATLDANGLSEARIRITLTGGRSVQGFHRASVPPTLVVAALPPPPPATAAHVVVAPWPRNHRGALAGIKTISGGEAVRALKWARDRGADEAVFADLDGRLCEGTSSNVFVVREGELRTPSLTTGCLDGVTRQLLLEVVCPRLEVGCVEAEDPVDVLGACEEAFLTSSTRRIEPISYVDGRLLPACPGPVTAALQRAFDDLVASEPDP